MRVKVGEFFEIPLEGHLTGGYGWLVSMPPSAAGLVTLLGETAEIKTELNGSASVQHFRFQALGQGEVTLTFVYKRPWESKPREERKIVVHIDSTP
jgi:predicted secreted protein